MTKEKKTIMWSSIACLCALAIAGGTIGVTYARYTTSSTGSGAAAVAYWDVAVTPTDSAEISIYAYPDATEYSSEARTHTSDLQLAATIVNSGDVAATVTVASTGSLSYTLRSGAEDKSSEAAAILTEAALAAHFEVELFQGTNQDGTDKTALGGTLDLAAKTENTPTTAYIFCDLIWKSDVTYTENTTEVVCTGDAADEFDTFVGTYVESINFGLSYVASQKA